MTGETPEQEFDRWLREVEEREGLGQPGRKRVSAVSSAYIPWWIGVPVALLLAGFVFYLGARPARSEPIARDRIHMVDGDTVFVNGHEKNTRLIGFNAPEKGRRAQCKAENDLGVVAADRLVELLNEGPLDITFLPCACRPGTEGTQACNHGRTCARLTFNGTDVGATLFAEELAVPFVCGDTNCPPTPKPWRRDRR